MKKSLTALACGTFGLGMAEFLMMGILSLIAKDLNVSIPEAGHFIAAYALGVSTGALLLVFAARTRPLKHILLGLVIIFIIGNFCVSISGNYSVMLVMRFISGLPHGGFFGVGSIVAEKVAPKGKESQAVSLMILGMTAANLVGIPLGTYLSHLLGWRDAFLLIAVWGIITLAAIWLWVPSLPALPDKGFKNQFAFLKNRAPWILLAAIMLGNGGFFCWYSYVNPMMTKVSGFAVSDMTMLMILSGLGMVLGNLISGKLADMYSPQKIATDLQALLSAALVLIMLLAANPWASAGLMFICAGCLFGISAPQQVLIIKYSPGGEMLGSSSAQVFFNLGNALGALSGGVPIAMGFNYQYSAVPGAIFAFIGFVLLRYFSRRYGQSKS